MPSSSSLCHFLLLAIALTTPLAAQKKGQPDFSVSGDAGVAVDGVRQLASYEEDVFGPLPYPEIVQRFVNDEITLLLERQREDGSFEMLAGRNTEAGGTVDGITLASLCGYSLRQHVEVDPEKIERAISRALGYVVYMVRSGKLRNGRDAAWRYAYSFRFLVNEYLHIKDAKKRELVEDAAIFLLHGLKDLQQGTKGQRSTSVSWSQLSSPGIGIRDDEESGRAVVDKCPAESPAFKAGIRKGDRLGTANGVAIHTSLRYSLQQLEWKGGDIVNFQVLRDGNPLDIKVQIPSRFPGVIGLTYRDNKSGEVVVEGFGPLGDLTGKVKLGDRIVKIDGKPATSADVVSGMQWFSGQRVAIELEREGKSKSVEIACIPVSPGSLGVMLKGGLDQTTLDGFPIQKLSAGSPFRQAGLTPGDRLYQIGDIRIMNRRHFSKIEDSLWGGQPVTVIYLNADGGERKSVDIETSKRSYKEWLQGYHGLAISNARVNGAKIMKVDPGSPAEVAGCQNDDVITAINGQAITSPRVGLNRLSGMFAGSHAKLVLQRGDETIEIEFEIHRPADSPWVSGTVEKSGGWAYYTYVRGGTVFLTSDILRELIRARETFPFHIPDEMISQPFTLLSKLRWKQPNGTVESYRYDWGGSFGGVRDIRGDIGRLCAAELSCLMYSESGLPVEQEMVRTQDQLAATLKEWLRHRGILEYRRSGGHGKFSIAPWYLPYSYMTTLEAASHLTGNENLKELLQRTALKAYFEYCELQPIGDLGGKDGWQIGYYNKKELLRSCLILDGLATMKHLYQPVIEVEHPKLEEAMRKFRASKYNEAYKLVKQSGAPDPSVDKILKAIDARLNTRIDEISEIHKTYHRDALRYLQELAPEFKGIPAWSKAEKLISNWDEVRATE